MIVARKVPAASFFRILSGTRESPGLRAGFPTEIVPAHRLLSSATWGSKQSPPGPRSTSTPCFGPYFHFSRSGWVVQRESSDLQFPRWSIPRPASGKARIVQRGIWRSTSSLFPQEPRAFYHPFHAAAQFFLGDGQSQHSPRLFAKMPVVGRESGRSWQIAWRTPGRASSRSLFYLLVFREGRQSCCCV